MLMDLYNNDDGVEFTATMNVVLDQVQTRMGMIMRPDIPWGFGYYVGEFGEIEPGPTLKRKGKGEFGRITKEVYEAEKEKATEDAICQYVNAGIAVTLSIATANPMVGAAYMSWNQFGLVATGDVSFQHWAVQTGVNVAASAAGGYVEGVTHSAVYGTLANSSIQGLGNFVEYKGNGGLGLQWGSRQQWRSFGIGTATALVGAKVNANSNISAFTRYGYNMSSSFIVNRFDGRGSWQDDMLQAGASTVAMLASTAILSDDTVFGQYIAGRNSTLAMQRFMQGTLENMLLATGGMWIGSQKGESLGNQLRAQNWQKTQFTLTDYAAAEASRYFKEIGQKQAESARKAMQDMEKKEGLLGLAWLGLRRAGSLLGSAVDGVSEFFDSIFDSNQIDAATLQRQKDIEESKKMWESGQMQKEVDKNILSREAQYINAIQDTYTDRNIRNSDDNPNNIREYNGNSAEMYERLMYYEAKLRTSLGVDNLDTLLDLNIPVVIGEEGKGAGLHCTDGRNKETGDTYNDRITKIYKDKYGNIHIEEYYRANIDVSSTSNNPSVDQGEYDFVVGTHGNDRFTALNIFKNNKERLEQIILQKDPREQDRIWKNLDNNEIDYGIIKKDDILRTLPANNGKTQKWINLHGGSNSSTDSKGCFTIYGMDWNNNTPQKDYKKFLETFRKNQLGKVYIIR